MKNLRFKNDEADMHFFKTLQERVNAYFAQNNLAKTANNSAKIKAVLLLSAYMLAFISVFFAQSLFFLYAMYALMGNLTIFVALNIAHDAAHQTFSSSRRINKLLLYTFDFLGASGYMWQLKHVHSHHPHVNIPNMDGDIKQSNLVRIFPNAPYFSFHRYQHIYMPVLYALYTLIWLLFRDFKDYFYTDISGKPDISHSKKQYARLLIGKSIFIGRMIVLPYIVLSFSFWQIIGAFILFHVCASYTVALALISAHVGEHSVYPMPNNNGQMSQSWVRHQIVSTCDFATDNRLISHLFGGFNHHVIHHLFPNICHIHYPPLTKILVKTCEEYNMPYRANSSLWQAVASHWKFLKKRSQQV